MNEQDPLWKMRHALVGLGLALGVSVPLAAWAGAALGDLFADRYGLRVALYVLLLAYVITGAVRLFNRVAAQESRRLTVPRLLQWLASLWLWPLLLRRR